MSDTPGDAPAQAARRGLLERSLDALERVGGHADPRNAMHGIVPQRVQRVAEEKESPRRHRRVNAPEHLFRINALRKQRRGKAKAELHRTQHRGAGRIARGHACVEQCRQRPADEGLVSRIGGDATGFSGEVGVSCWNGFALVRFCAKDAAGLRRDVMNVLARIDADALPRLWLN